jgi:transcriptional regulator with XRE-family HTH domain
MSSTSGTPVAAETEEELRKALAAQVRRARKRRGLSGRKLAELASVTPAAISQIELAQITPSIATLLRIAQALDVRIVDLFEAKPPEPNKVLSPDEWEVFQYPDRSFEDALLSADPDQRLGIGWTRLAPGATLDNEGLTHLAHTQFVFVLSGQLEIQIRDEAHLLGERFCITFFADSPHNWRNPGPEPVEFLWATAPGVY